MGNKRQKEEMIPVFSSELSTLGEHSWFKVIVESGTSGLTRVNISRGSMSSQAPENSQGMDLSVKGCRSLANMLMAAAEIAEDSPHGRTEG